MVATDNIALIEAERDIRDGDGRKTARRFLEFVVNDSPLGRPVREAGYDLISCLWVDNATAVEESVKAAGRLLGDVAADAPQGRVSVYGCAKCGDLGCGAVTVRLEVTDTTVAWADWGYQTSYGDEVHDVDAINGLRKFTFARREYMQVIDGAKQRISQQM